METLTLRSRISTLPYFTKALLVHALFAATKVAFILYGGTSLFFEEAQYWLWSNNLDLSYYSKPPLIAYVNKISTGIFGINELAIRLNAIICGFLIAVIIYLFTEKITQNSRKAFWSSVLLTAFPYFWIVSFFFTTDSLVTLFWTWAIYAFYFACEDKPVYWVWTGLAVGLGFLSKYVMAFFWPLALVYLFIYRKDQLRQPFLYLSIILSVVFLIPVLYWNYDHDWVSVKHVISLAGGNHQNDSVLSLWKSITQFLEYAGGQILIWILPFIGIILLGIKKLFQGRLKRSDVLIVVPVFAIVVFFGFLSFFTRVELNWTFFALPPIAVFIALHTGESEGLLRTKVIAVAGIMIIMLALPLFGRYFNYPARLNPLKRIVGWEQLSESLESVITKYNGKVLLVADSYKTASMLSFYLPGHPEVLDFSPDQRMNQFDIWRKEHQHGEVPYTTIYIGESELSDGMLQYFGEEVERGTIARPYNQSESLLYEVLVFDAFYGFSIADKEQY